MTRINIVCFFSIIVCLLFSTTSFASDDLFTNIEVLNGHEWVEMVEEEKDYFVRGFIMGFNTMHISLITEFTPGSDYIEVLKELKEEGSLFEERAVSAMIETFDEMYAEEENRDKGIFQLMLEGMME